MAIYNEIRRSSYLNSSLLFARNLGSRLFFVCTVILFHLEVDSNERSILSSH